MAKANLRSYPPEFRGEAEAAKLCKSLAEACMERDVIKKAAAYFARESLPGTRK